MNILQIANQSNIHGGEIVALNICKYLPQFGHNIFLVSPGSGDLTSVAEKQNIPYFIVPFSRTISFHAIPKLIKIIRKHNIDCIISHSTIPNILGRLTTLLNRQVKHFAMVHLVLELTKPGRNKSSLALFKDYYYKYFDNLTAALDTKTITVSHGVYQDQIRQGISPDKLVVIQNGININPFSNISRSYNNEVITIGMIARLSPQKGHIYLIRAIEKLTAKYNNLRVICYGEGPLQDYLSQIIDEKNLTDIISLPGYTNDIVKAYTSFDIYVLPSLWEGLPLSLLEAMAAKLPVVATNIPGTNEVIIDNKTGYYVEPENVSDLTEKLEILISHPDQRKRMGEFGFTHLQKKFDIQIFIKKLHQLLISV